MRNTNLRATAFSAVLLLCASLAAQGTVFNYSDSAGIPMGGGTISWEHTISGIDPSISSVELVLTFADATHLDGSTIRGQLLLGTTGGSPYVNLSPTATSTSGGHPVYDVVFTGASGSGTGFNGSNPNGTWSLSLWDTTTPASGGGNGLLGWSLDITPVPEPVNVALGIFGALAAAGMLLSWRLKARRAAQTP